MPAGKLVRINKEILQAIEADITQLDFRTGVETVLSNIVYRVLQNGIIEHMYNIEVVFDSDALSYLVGPLDKLQQ